MLRKVKPELYWKSTTTYVLTSGKDIKFSYVYKTKLDKKI